MIMGDKNKQGHVRTMYTEDSYLEIGLFYPNLSLSIGGYNKETGHHDNSNAHTTTITHEEACILRNITKLIANGLDSSELEVIIPCNSGDTVSLVFKAEQDDYISAYLGLDKNGQKLSFKFPTRTYQMKERGKTNTVLLQAGLESFSGVLDGFITTIDLPLEQISKL